MKTIAISTRLLLLITLLLCGVMPVFAQTKAAITSTQRNDFYQLTKEANLNFTFPPGFRQVKATNNEDYSFDYAMEAPGKKFEVWLQVRSQKQNWASYEKARANKNTELANPDSMYIEISKAIAITLSGSTNYLERNLATDVLERYNADAGKSYLVNLLDSSVTGHYKYALILSLQKDHTGTLMAVFFTNDKDPDFYKLVYRAGHCLKFKPATAD
jgi:hypothetical protein